MSQENVEIVRRMFAEAPDLPSLWRDGAFSDDAWLSLWHPECILEELAEVPDSAVYRGREGITRYFLQFGEEFEDLRYTATEILDGSEGVLSATDMWAHSRAGVETQMRVYQVFRLLDGMIVYATGYIDREQALEAVGLRG